MSEESPRRKPQPRENRANDQTHTEVATLPVNGVLEAFGALPVAAFARLHGKRPKTIRVWISEGKVAAQKDPGGHCWLVFVKKKTAEDDPG